MKDRRKLDRKYLAVYSRVFDRVTGRVLGYLADLSRKGAMLIGDESLLEGQAFSLRFDLPDPELFGANHLNMEARVAWCSPDVDPSFCNIGLVFQEVSAQDSRIIDLMIEAYEFSRSAAEGSQD